MCNKVRTNVDDKTKLEGYFYSSHKTINNKITLKTKDTLITKLNAS